MKNLMVLRDLFKMLESFYFEFDTLEIEDFRSDGTLVPNKGVSIFIYCTSPISSIFSIWYFLEGFLPTMYPVLMSISAFLAMI